VAQENPKERFLLKLKVNQSAKTVLDRWKDETGIPQNRLASTIYVWFDEQPEEFQRAILGLLGSRAPDIARLYLEGIAKGGPPAKVKSERPGGRKQSKEVGRAKREFNAGPRSSRSSPEHHVRP
jgi:hypothetical protein